MDHSQSKPPSSEEPTVPSASNYDYSHLRESPNEGHWYSSDLAAAQAQTQVAARSPEPPPPAPFVPQQAIPPVNYPMPRESVARQRSNQRQKRRSKGMPDNWAWVVIAVALLGITLVCSMSLILVIRTQVNNDKGTSLANVPLIEPTSIIYQDDDGALAGNSLEIQSRKWTGQERFTILLMGLDKRPGESGTVFRTDTMILVSLDPQNNRIGMLSIPRDLYVEVPYYGLHRVNSAYVLGELEQPGNGATLAKQTVQYNFGIAVNEYVTVDFQTVIAIIDAIGGIDVDVEKAIVDYAYPTMNYGTEVFRVEAGWQKMDGITALKYARTRHASDDIDRARRQQQVIYAARDRVTSLDIVDDLVVQAPFLYAQIRDGIKTGLSVDQMIELSIWAADVPRENIISGVVSWEYLSGYQTPSGGSVLVPNRGAIGQLMVEVFGENYSQ